MTIPVVWQMFVVAGSAVAGSGHGHVLTGAGKYLGANFDQPFARLRFSSFPVLSYS